MATKTKRAAARRATPAEAGTTDTAALAQIAADLGAIASFLGKLPGIESSLAVEHEAVREIARRRSA